MRLQDFDTEDGKRVWLTQAEIDLLVEQSDATEEAAFLLGARAGLRRGEIVNITPNDFMQAPDGWLRVWPDYAKGDAYRETPIPTELSALIRGMGGDPDEPVIDVAGNTVRRWVKRAASACAEATDDPGWEFLSPHDLRRTWGGHLLWDRGVLPAVVMSWGGWADWETFRQHYLGEMSPKAAERERSKVFGHESPEDPVFEPTMAMQPEGTSHA